MLNYKHYAYADFSELKGKVLSSIVNDDNDSLTFTTEDGEKFLLYHIQDCCEHVRIEDIEGDFKDLLGSPILIAEEVSGETGPYEGSESYLWTFYKLATIQGSVTIRWLGESNGYYSESVDFRRVITVS